MPDRDREMAGRRRLARGARSVAESPLIGGNAAAMPLRAALYGAASGLETETAPVREAGLVGKFLPIAQSVATGALESVAGEVGEQAELAEAVLYGRGIQDAKAANRAAQETHAAGTAARARTDPASGTRQGASSPGQGTGTIASATGETGGVTTGEPGGSRLQISAPGLKEHFAETPFLSQRPAPEPTRPLRRTRGPESPAGHGGALWTRSEIPEAAQILSDVDLARGLEAGSQSFKAEMEKSRAEEGGAKAAGARAEVLAEEPFYVEELDAKGKLSEAQVEASTEIAGRQEIKAIVSGAAEQINELRADPRYMQLPPAERKRIEDQIWDQARLALSALTETNLYPRPDPFSFMAAMAPTAPEEK